MMEKHSLISPPDVAREVKRCLAEICAPDVVKIGIIVRMNSVQSMELTYALAENGTPFSWLEWKPRDFRYMDPAVAYTLVLQRTGGCAFLDDIWNASVSKSLPERYRPVPLRLMSEISSGALLPLRTRFIFGGLSLHWLRKSPSDLKEELSPKVISEIRRTAETTIFRTRHSWKQTMLLAAGLTERQIEIVEAEGADKDLVKAFRLGISASGLSREWRKIANALGFSSRRLARPMIEHLNMTGFLLNDDQLDLGGNQALLELIDSHPFWLNFLQERQGQDFAHPE